MAKESRTVGRPRNFDELDVVDQAVTTFWRYGGTNTTMRVLGDELGLMPASIYNAFGSKQQLLERALERYLDQVGADLLAPLEAPEAGAAELEGFIEQLVGWVTDSVHPGCMMLNLLAEQPPGDTSLNGLAHLHRERMRSAFLPALTRLDAEQADTRAHLLVAGSLGISVAARGGASEGEMSKIADAVKDQICRWYGS